MEWEGEPMATFGRLSEKFDINKSEISRKAAKEGWTKRGVIGDINEAAQRKADGRCDADGNPTKKPTGQREPNVVDLPQRIISEDLRADVLVRHRKEWAELISFRKSALAAMKAAHENGDKISWQVAKMAADTALANLRALAVAQEGERKAWGLDLKVEEEIIITNPRIRDAANEH